jgi:hypothetical protein
MGHARPISVTIVLDDLGDESISKALDRLRAAGLQVEDVQSAIGTVTGKIAPERLKQLSKVHGVISVEKAEEYQLPPPDSAIQ